MGKGWMQRLCLCPSWSCQSHLLPTHPLTHSLFIYELVQFQSLPRVAYRSQLALFLTNLNSLRILHLTGEDLPSQLRTLSSPVSLAGTEHTQCFQTPWFRGSLVFFFFYPFCIFLRISYKIPYLHHFHSYLHLPAPYPLPASIAPPFPLSFCNYHHFTHTMYLEETFKII